MIVVVSITFISILFTFFDSRGVFHNGLLLGFILVTILGCIHYNYGNDYVGYHEMYYEITQIPLRLEYLIDDVYGHESGWVVLNHFFSHFGGFYTMVAVLNIIQNAIYYSFIKENVPKQYWTFAIMVYLLSTSLYLLNFSMMRQGLTNALFVYSWKYMKNKRVMPALIVILLASTIHHSAQMIIPFVFLSVISLNNRIVVSIYVSLILLFYFSASSLSGVFESLGAIEKLQSSKSIDYYSQGTDIDDLSTIGLGFILNMIPFVAAMWVLIRRRFVLDNTTKALIVISMVSFLIAPFGQILSIVGRFGMYFDAYKVAAIPCIYSYLPKKWNQVCTYTYCFMLLYGYYLFFTSSVWVNDYSTFHTVFSLLFN